jgi:acyl-coenzyme A thioesterase PaaI-like protein
MPYAARLAGDTESGIIASGPIFALLDMASGMSIGFANGALKPRVTLDLRVDYLRPAKPGSAIIGRSHCYRRTKSVAFVRGFAHDGDAERPVAQMAGTFMFIEDTPETEQP